MRFRDTAVALRGPIRIHTQAARPSTVPRRTSPAVWACALRSQILPFLRPPPLRVSDFAQSAHVDPENQGTAAQGRPYPDFRNLCHLQLPSRAASLGGGCGGWGARCCNSLAWFLLHTKALAQIGLFVNEDFSRDNISKRHEHLQNVLVSKLLWKVVNKEVCTLWT